MPALPKRRRFPADYKARVVEEAEGCTEPGAIGALLRRESLYSSQLSSCRVLYRTGALQALRDDKRGRKTKKHPLEHPPSLPILRLRIYREAVYFNGWALSPGFRKPRGRVDLS